MERTILRKPERSPRLLPRYGGGTQQGAAGAGPAVPMHLRFELRGRAALRSQGNVREVGMRGRPVPVFLMCRDMHDIANRDFLLLRLGGDNAGARRHKQHLITTVGVHFIAHTRWEVHNPEIKMLAHLRRQNRLSADLACEQWTRGWFSGYSAGFNDLHGFFSLARADRCAFRGTEQ